MKTPKSPSDALEDDDEGGPLEPPLPPVRRRSGDHHQDHGQSDDTFSWFIASLLLVGVALLAGIWWGGARWAAWDAKEFSNQGAFGLTFFVLVGFVGSLFMIRASDSGQGKWGGMFETWAVLIFGLTCAALGAGLSPDSFRKSIGGLISPYREKAPDPLLQSPRSTILLAPNPEPPTQYLELTIPAIHTEHFDGFVVYQEFEPGAAKGFVIAGLGESAVAGTPQVFGRKPGTTEIWYKTKKFTDANGVTTPAKQSFAEKF